MQPQALVLLCGDLENEVCRESSAVPVDLLVEAFYRHPIKLRQMGIQNDLLITESQNPQFLGYGECGGRGSHDDETHATRLRLQIVASNAK